jgi:hypothetical protein
MPKLYEYLGIAIWFFPMNITRLELQNEYDINLRNI